MNKQNGARIERVVIAGVGGVGYWTAAALARNPLGREVICFDDDTFEGGLGKLRLPRAYDEKVLKVASLGGFVGMVMGDKPPIMIPQKLIPEYFREDDDLGDTLVVDCTDMALAPRKELWDVLKARRARMLRVSYDGADGGILVVSHSLPWATLPGGRYESVPTLPMSMAVGGLGAMAITWLLEGREFADYQVQLPAIKEEEKKDGHQS